MQSGSVDLCGYVATVICLRLLLLLSLAHQPANRVALMPDCLSRACPAVLASAKNYWCNYLLPGLRICHRGSDASFGQGRASVVVISDVL